jgi:hypothetical protein
MSKVDVVLVNATGDDIRVGAGPTLIEVPAGSSIEAQLEDTSAEAYGLLVQGVALVPAQFTVEELTLVEPLLQEDPEPEPEAEPEGDEAPAEQPAETPPAPATEPAEVA